MLETTSDLSAQLCDAHKQLVRYGLVKWTMGNISIRRDEYTILIKPSGVRYETMMPEDMVVVHISDLNCLSQIRPSTDTNSHCYVYKHWHREPEINAIVHTHSTYATAWAITGRPIPTICTMIADEFGFGIPCARYATIGDDDIGMAIMEELEQDYTPALLLKQHGVFTFGRDVEEAVKAAVMVEEAAKVAYIALQMNPRARYLATSEIELAHHRYTYDYGQKK